MISLAHCRTLTRLELRRAAPLFGRMAGFAAATMSLFILTGHATGENLIVSAVGTSAAFVFMAPLLVLRDKLEGTLDVLRSLPTSADNVAAAKLASAALCTVLPAVQIALTAAWVAGIGRAQAPAFVAAALVGSWALLTLAAWLLLGVLTRFDPEQLTLLPTLGFAVVVLVVGPLLRRTVPDPVAALRWLAVQPWLGALLSVVSTALAAAAGAAAFWLTRSGVAHFVPSRLRVTGAR